MTSVATAVGRSLADLGARQVFGVVGSGNYHATAALVAGGATYHAVRHESAAVGACDALWRTAGQVAVASVHQGPGFTNALTTLGEAAKSRSPLVLIAGSTPTNDLRSTFRADQAAAALAVGALVDRVHSPQTVVEDVARAWNRALDARRPVLLELPLDVQPLPAEQDGPAAVLPPVPPARPASVQPLVDALASARRPLLLAGRGVMLSGARDDIVALAERTRALLATSAQAKDLFAGHPANLGILGGFSPAWVVDALADVDLIVALGCSLTHWTTRGDSLVADRTVVQVDDDPAALRLNAHVDVSILGDVAATVAETLARVTEQDAAPRTTPTVTPVVPEWPDEVRGVHPGAAIARLDELLPAERTLVVDGGHFIGWPITGITVPDPSGFVFSSGGFQAIGLGLGAALGATLGRPDRLTVLVAGDGGWQMSLVELETAVRLGLRLLVVVLNDDAYGAEVHHFGADDAAADLVQFPPSDLARIAAGFGAASLTVSTLGDLDGLGDWLDGGTGPMVVDVRIDPTIVGYWAEQDFFKH